jgi:serine/threonine protein kinase
VFQPTTFGKYFLTRRIAVGGMAEVYAAKLYGADGFEKDLVIKQILPQYSRDPEFIQSFVAEAKIAVSLNHANVVGIYELGRVDGTYFIAMEYVDGLDVFQLLDYARKYGFEISPGIGLLVAEEVAKGLDYAHRKAGADGEPLELVHRDLNPRNVLISREGEVKILDFGIAKTASKAAAMPKTRAGVVKGTTGYMSPEQAVGLDVDARTDIYQNGLLLYELLTGEALFWRPDDEVTRNLMRAHRVPAPSERVPTLPLEVDQICLRLLSKDADQRLQTAADLVQVLGRLRFLFYPDEDHRRLGHLVTALLEQRSEEVAAHSQSELAPVSLPSTMELSDVISQAIEHSITEDIETIATRFPKDRSNTPGAVPLQVKSDHSVAETPALGTAQPPFLPPPVAAAFPRAEHPPTLDLVAPDVPLSQPSPAAGRMRALWMGGVAVLVLGAVLAVATGGDDEVSTEAREATMVASLDDRATVPAATDEGAPPAASSAPDPAPTELRSETPARPAPDPARRVESSSPVVLASGAVADAVVAFGTRSCSSRVSVDGQVLTRTTPSYDHKLSAGRHRVVVEGVSCPAVERPGSLRRSIPVVVRDIDIPAGGRLKIIADFDADELVVKRQ